MGDGFSIGMAFMAVFGASLLLLLAPVHCRKSGHLCMKLYCFYMLSFYILTAVNIFKYSHLSMLTAITLRKVTTLEWCDIALPLLQFTGAGMCTSEIVLFREILAHLSAPHKIVRTRRNTIINLSIGVAVPAILSALQYVTQGHRSNILEGVGCSEPVLSSLPALFLGGIWALLLPLIAAVYAGK